MYVTDQTLTREMDHQTFRLHRQLELYTCRPHDIESHQRGLPKCMKLLEPHSQQWMGGRNQVNYFKG